MLPIFDTVHDYMEYPDRAEVRSLINQSSDQARVTNHSSQRFVAWYVFGAAGCLSPILYSTINVIVRDDAEERALIMVCPFHL